MHAEKVLRPAHTTPVTRYVVGVAFSVLLALLVGYVLLRPPMADMAQLALQLSATAALSIVAGFVVFRWGWVERTPRVAYAIIGGYVLATALTVFNVWVSARLMFLDQHDLMLGTSLLVFAGGIAIALGAFFSDAVTERLERLRSFAADVAHGRLDARVVVAGNDEVADLAHSLNAMAQQLEDGQRRQAEMEAMRRDLIAWAGHDLRTPLASVRAIVEMLADGMVSDSDTVERYLRTAQRDIRSLTKLIDDQFEMAQIDAGGLQLRCETISLADLISDTIESFAAVAAARDTSIGGSVAADVDPVWLDAERIGRVLTNLVSNALRYSSEGGEVQVRAERVQDTVLVTVSDLGEGIAADQLDQVFERFHRADASRSRATGGSGLGLTIAKGIVEAHGGTIGIDSRVGEGTSVWFKLPVHGTAKR